MSKKQKNSKAKIKVAFIKMQAEAAPTKDWEHECLIMEGVNNALMTTVRSLKEKLDKEHEENTLHTAMLVCAFLDIEKREIPMYYKEGIAKIDQLWNYYKDKAINYKPQ